MDRGLWCCATGVQIDKQSAAAGAPSCWPARVVSSRSKLNSTLLYSALLAFPLALKVGVRFTPLQVRRAKLLAAQLQPETCIQNSKRASGWKFNYSAKAAAQRRCLT